MEKIVIGCKSCPMNETLDAKDSWCNHPLSEGKYMNIEEPYYYPYWCPLKTEPIIISLKTDTNG